MSRDELCAAFQLSGRQPWLLPSIWGEDCDVKGGHESLRRRKLASKRRLSRGMAEFIETLAHPEMLLDIFRLRVHGRGASRLSIVNGKGTFSLIINDDRVSVGVTDLRSALRHLWRGVGSVKTLPAGAILSAEELSVLLLIVSMNVYDGETPGLGTFTPEDVLRDIRMGLHLPLLAQTRLYFAEHRDGSLDVNEILDSLREKGLIEAMYGENDNGRNLSISSEFLPIGLIIGSPEVIDVLSVVKGPESELPDARTLMLFRFGRAVVAIDLLDEDAFHLYPMRGEDHLREVLEEFLFQRVNLKEELDSLDLMSATLIRRGEISKEDYSSASRLVSDLR